MLALQDYAVKAYTMAILPYHYSSYRYKTSQARINIQESSQEYYDP
jgi:hypothetical protein